MKRKNILWIIVGILIISTIYFGYKGFNLYYYSTENVTEKSYNDFISGLEIKDTWTITPAIIDYESYLIFKNISIPNSFKKFEKQEKLSTEDSVKYNLYDENRKVKASFWMTITDTYVNLLKTDKTVFGIDDIGITNAELTSLLNKNKIKTDIDLFKYLKSQKYPKNNIFTSVKEMKQNYTIKYLASVMLPKTENITLLDGAYKGYIFNCNDIKEINIIKDDKRYVFTFFKLDYFKDEFIKRLIEAVEIS